MIVLCGVDEFPSGPWTEELASRFADRVGAELVIVDGGPAADHVAAIEDARDGGVLLFGHAPPRGVTAALRDAPCPVVVVPAGVSAREWGEVVLGTHGDSCSEEAAATAGILASRLDAVLRVVVVVRPAHGLTGWQLYDAVRRLTDAAQIAAGAELTIEPEVHEGSPPEEILEAAAERDTSLVVVAADQRPTWRDLLRSSFTATLLHDSRELVVVVPPAPPPLDEPRAVPDRRDAVRA